MKVTFFKDGKPTCPVELKIQQQKDDKRGCSKVEKTSTKNFPQYKFEFNLFSFSLSKQGINIGLPIRRAYPSFTFLKLLTLKLSSPKSFQALQLELKLGSRVLVKLEQSLSLSQLKLDSFQI